MRIIVLFAFLHTLTFSVSVNAQTFGGVGTRAAGMAGAFVAVADDASAVYWNPAGIATGTLVSAVIDFGQGQTGKEPIQVSAAQRDTGFMVAFSATSVGLAYYRLGAY